MESQPCNKCACPLVWDRELKDPRPADKAKNKGWWREDLTKELHTLERCKKFQDSGEFTLGGSRQAPVKIESQKSETVNWPKIVDDFSPEQIATLEAEEIYCIMAVEATKKLHPTLDPNSSTFGQIVSAKEGHLIQLAKIKAIRELKEK